MRKLILRACVWIYPEFMQLPSITFPSEHRQLGVAGCGHLTDVETEAERGDVSSPRMPTQWVVEPGLTCKSPGSRLLLYLFYLWMFSGSPCNSETDGSSGEGAMCGSEPHPLGAFEAIPNRTKNEWCSPSSLPYSFSYSLIHLSIQQTWDECLFSLRPHA